MIIKCIKSFRYAFHGLRTLLKTENNARIHLMASIVAVSLGLF
ncbi:MAG: diacylglycerol kinase, partial [Cytophagaceae bacterium]